ncbi:MAG: hypothetical protein HC876_14705 [Chloroflexaceae bacterium]|nr:hypothetical protein [Chloroflexaceae bacterium]
MNSALWGLIGGIVGTVFGILGGAYGTYMSIKNTRTSEARTFMIRASVVAWIAIMVFLLALFFLPTPQRFLVWIPYPFALVFGIWYINRRLARLQADEQALPQETRNNA